MSVRHSFTTDDLASPAKPSLLRAASPYLFDERGNNLVRPRALEAWSLDGAPVYAAFQEGGSISCSDEAWRTSH